LRVGLVFLKWNISSFIENVLTGGSLLFILKPIKTIGIVDYRRPINESI